MEKENLTVSINMNDYQKKIENYDFNKLLAEKEKILNKQNVSYTYVSLGSYYTQQINISENPDEKNRIYVRKKVAMLSKIISGQLSSFAVDYASYWKYINDEFLKTTSDPDYVTARLQGKTVPFADKLNLQGLTAYKRFLVVLSDNLEKTPYFNFAVQNALDAEIEYDQDLNRDKFYTRYFLPQSIDSIFKNLMKEKIVDNRLKELGNVAKAEKTEENIK